MRGSESITSVEGTLSRGERDRDLEGGQTLSQRRNLHVYLEQLYQGECAAQTRLSEAEADMDIRNWEQRNSDIAFFLKPIENSNLKDWSCIRRINGHIRCKEKRLIFVEN